MNGAIQIPVYLPGVWGDKFLPCLPVPPEHDQEGWAKDNEIWLNKLVSLSPETNDAA